MASLQNDNDLLARVSVKQEFLMTPYHRLNENMHGSREQEHIQMSNVPSRDHLVQNP